MFCVKYVTEISSVTFPPVKQPINWVHITKTLLIQ